mmetsp:Transcript_94415/g.163178  ORF Transcript_94415/g.163178 Transcript_94415/m.163178 type:complete len:433 (-) Transcript_94415:1844-3142(-)
MPALTLASKISSFFTLSSPFLLSDPSAAGSQSVIGRHLIRNPMSNSVAPNAMQMPHCCGLIGVVCMKGPKNCTATNWKPTHRRKIARNALERHSPPKGFFSEYNFRALNSLKSWNHMNVLKIQVECTAPLTQLPFSSIVARCFTSSRVHGPVWNIVGAKKMTMKIPISCHAACPKIKDHMRREINGAARRMGLDPGRVRQSSAGHSVARARAAKVSMIRLSHSSCTGFKGSSLCSFTAEPMSVRSTPATLTVSWNWRNFRMFSFTVRPQAAARTTVAKLSSISTISAAPVATSVPVRMANPASASFRAGASFVPSPVTATMSPWSMMHDTNSSLSVGLLRASTFNLGMRRSSFSGSVVASSRNAGPSMTVPSSGSVFGERMPHFLAMAMAVFLLSPVTIRTEMPALLQLSTAVGTSGRIGSWIPITPIRVYW